MGYGFHSNSFCVIVLVLISSCLLHHASAKLVVDIGCDIYNDGSWVKDNSSPHYDALSCPFIDKRFDCRGNGRPDKLYLNYLWLPTACILPSFDTKIFFKMVKGMTILFVGDSLSENQWQSLICILHTSVPHAKYIKGSKNGVSTFELPDYNVSLNYDRNLFLVDLVTESTGKVLKLDSVSSGDRWKNADVLIFNTWHWWFRKGSQQPWKYIEHGGKLYDDMDPMVAFKKGFTTWSKWVDSNINPKKTQVIYQGISPTHFGGAEWNQTKHSCIGQTEPSSGYLYPGGPLPGVAVVKKLLDKMSTPVFLLDVTTLSQLRKDGHPSLYGGGEGVDCGHWCLAGVPDTWNIFLYISIMQNSTVFD